MQEKHPDRLHECCTHRPVADHNFEDAFTSGRTAHGATRAAVVYPLNAVGSVQWRRRWSGRCGVLIIARGTFRVRFGGSFGSPPGFHRRRKLSATFRRKIELFFAFLTAAGFFGSARLEDLAAARAARAADFLAAFSFFAVSAACSLCFSLASFFGSSCRRFSIRRIFFFKFFVFIILCVRWRQTRIKGSLHS